MTLVVGAHPQNLSLSILARRPDVVARLREQGLGFFVYGAGSQTIPLLKAGVLHLAGTGATPPILAKAEGLATAVFGMSGPRPERGGLLVREASGIRDLAGLRGKGIGLMPISWHTQFLAAELDAARLGWDEVRAAEIIPATAKDAFVDGLLDAIVATDPLYSQIAKRIPTRILASPGAAFSNRSVYWGLSGVLRDRPDLVRILLDALIDSDRATAENPEEAAALLAGLNGNSAAEWLSALTSRPWGVEAPDQDFLAEQQAHADIFAKFGLIQRAIDVTDTIDPTHFSAAA
ncbi:MULTISPECIES: ABC transporter substrate-binding protein [Bradyrhizobium]|jgi:sulfonate transport system substrate-binding protein|uniref:ABC transporter substrate-binding protein n=1 Tax=Bradyrhizobium TaxID=374 RepID=UPI0004862991|nr:MULTISPECIES: ABC transporter substrate-binding protein [Bradyrhizobium]MCS3451204.1 ABC-type nitrate/sulfonate/bicarbonate transport system substrate-binding protein [Bradyrhizobium elkanii]MCS3566773.1 ABC-type nitrate/sulfonate/bicarbonate transport system substrate-binding protein [Bradyrhizobium elkanii]MCW2152503.1 ABC-type nitrate/sulfonate/bicarbonate transport system substrate-binding protein [Bradyrhizobium elkanii]MCW2357620.1 ABC-type nitrate/sulfonate/bicarbonate transport syste